MFDWLRAERALIKSQTFHEFVNLGEDDFLYSHGDVTVPVRGDCSKFLHEFGSVNMFSGWGNLIDVPLIIYPLKEYRREVVKNGRAFVAFGDRGGQHVFFDESKILSEEPSAVFLLTKREAKEIYPNFSEWLKSSYQWAKSKYSRRQWDLVLKGAPPFTDHEQKIVEARSQFHWKHIGFAENGDALFEVENKSKMVLPFLSIGIKDCDEEILIGGAWLNVGHIRPGEKKTVSADCYKDRILPEKLVFLPSQIRCQSSAINIGSSGCRNESSTPHPCSRLRHLLRLDTPSQ